MKHIITTTLLLLALLLPTHALAHDFEVDGIYYNINGTNATVTYKGDHFNSYSNEYSGSVTIPATVTYSGTIYSVTSIGYGAFEYCSSLTAIDIPYSVTTIGDYAFYYCSSLTNIDIPNSVTNIGDDAFSDCSKLMSVTIEGPISRIQHSTFYNCRKLQTVRLPYDLISIGEKAFYFCEDLTDVTCLAKTPPSIEKYNSIYPGYYMATLHVPAQSVEAYKATDWWSHFINIEGDASNDASDPATSPVNKCDTNDDGEVNIADINKVIDAILTN